MVFEYAMRQSHHERQVCKPRDLEEIKRGYQCTVESIFLVNGRIVIKFFVFPILFPRIDPHSTKSTYS